MIIRSVQWDNVAATALREAQRIEIAERYGTDDSEPGPAPTADDITAFFVAFENDDPDAPALGCGGLRQLGASEAEVKRMYVTPAARGTGVSTALLDALESFGRSRGWSRLVLETGTEQPDAVRFYEREGFTSIPRFGYYADSEDSLCYEKSLIATDPALDTLCEGCE
ncbi:GNAT family N-acetyltransferase [Glaciihabitans arcticus]|uniref:GNAT family N-acetyltransferase n=1 Tax=Glaciihabitans arcticus TaxID=2668039 RepID=A0A4Q9GSP3_9MICO|nr:GNAT family N-acetyltransferase [Glaciihabitans arcticus]TBN58032.1 GNAT family N-acetyltransferase [Glaciihabitans arcticus]